MQYFRHQTEDYRIEGHREEHRDSKHQPKKKAAHMSMHGFFH